MKRIVDEQKSRRNSAERQLKATASALMKKKKQREELAEKLAALEGKLEHGSNLLDEAKKQAILLEEKKSQVKMHKV